MSRITASDGTASVTDDFDITIANSNDAPVIAGADNAASYNEGGAAAALDSTLTISDVDNASLAGATISISNNFTAGDRLNFTNQNGITGSYNSSTGVLTLSGSATVAQYEAALESITFDSTSGTPGNTTRTISYVVTDGTDSSSAVTTTVAVTEDISSTPIDYIVALGGAAFTSYDASANFSSPYTLSYTVSAYNALTGANVAGFTINSSTGVVSYTGSLPNSLAAYVVRVTANSGISTLTEELDVFTYSGSYTAGTTGDDSASISTAVLYDGDDGNDTITRTAGNGIIMAGDGNDTVTGAYYADGGQGNDVLTGQNNYSTISGGDGDDTITGGGGSSNNVFIGGRGADYFVGATDVGVYGLEDFRYNALIESNAASTDTITGFHEGSDLIDLNGSDFSAYTSIAQGAASGNALGYTFDGTYTILTASNGFTVKILGNVFPTVKFYDNVIRGDGLSNNIGTGYMLGAEVVYAGAGNDTITGGWEGDTLYGEDGDDRINAFSGGDVMYGGNGNDTIYGASHSRLLGEADNDSLVGASGGSDTITGGAGADTITGGTSTSLRDTFVYNTVAESDVTNTDVITDYQPGIDIIDLDGAAFSGITKLVAGAPAAADEVGYYVSGSDTILETQSGLRIILQGVTSGNVVVKFQDNILRGTDSADTIYGSTYGSATIYGGGGNDTLAGVDYGNDTIYGEDGNDSITAGVVSFGYNLYADGGAGDDTITGSTTADTIIGGAGVDSLTGGTGNDRFGYSANTDSGIGSGNRDIITDFTVGGDDIDLSAFAGTFTYMGSGGAAALTGGVAQVSWDQPGGSITVIYVDTDGNNTADFEIQLTGTLTLTSGDFIL